MWEHCGWSIRQRPRAGVLHCKCPLFGPKQTADSGAKCLLMTKSGQELLLRLPHQTHEEVGHAVGRAADIGHLGEHDLELIHHLLPDPVHVRELRALAQQSLRQDRLGHAPRPHLSCNGSVCRRCAIGLARDDDTSGLNLSAIGH